MMPAMMSPTFLPRALRLALGLGCLLMAAGARAAPEPAPARATPAAASASEWPAPAAPERLSAQRGGADTVSTQASLNATVADNTARNVVTGNNAIDGGAFANMTGLPMVIQNTGANVLIQNSTVINLQMR